MSCVQTNKYLCFHDDVIALHDDVVMKHNLFAYFQASFTSKKMLVKKILSKPFLKQLWVFHVPHAIQDVLLLSGRH